jgi:hypothetical protein
MLAKWFETLANGLFDTSGAGGSSAGGGWLGALLGAVGSGISGMFGGGSGGGYDAALGKWSSSGIPYHHAGGIVGDPTTPRKSVPDWLFHFAPRLHSGLAPDEFPAILQRGERVIPKGGQAGGQAVIVNIQANDAKSFQDMVNRNPGAILGPIMDSLRRGGAMRTAMRTNL